MVMRKGTMLEKKSEEYDETTMKLTNASQDPVHTKQVLCNEWLSVWSTI
jgi:hypothetical protein